MRELTAAQLCKHPRGLGGRHALRDGCEKEEHALLERPRSDGTTVSTGAATMSALKWAPPGRGFGGRRRLGAAALADHRSEGIHDGLDLRRRNEPPRGQGLGAI